jgi:hypothetical protein
MSGAPGLRSALLLVCAAVAGAGLVWLLVAEGEGPAERDPGSDESLAGGAATGLDQAGTAVPGESERERTTRARAQAAREEPGLPRVLPPDAAVEDIRDALALSGDARIDGLRRAHVAIARLLAQDDAVATPLRSYAQDVEDAAVRGNVIAAFGARREAASEAWLRDRLAAAPTAPERIGALIAFARPDAARPEDDPAVREASAATLGGLPYRYVALEATPDRIASLATILRTTSAQEAADALPILLASITAESAWGESLVGGANQICTWLLSLPLEDQARVKAAALRHERLSPRARKALAE